jgi:hypothetical protein
MWKLGPDFLSQVSTPSTTPTMLPASPLLDPNDERNPSPTHPVGTSCLQHEDTDCSERDFCPFQGLEAPELQGPVLIQLSQHIGVTALMDSEGSAPDAALSEGCRELPACADNTALPSSGSALHGKSQCRQCVFFPKGRCTNGYDCEFCHFAHAEVSHGPKSKKKRTQRKKEKCDLLDTASPASKLSSDAEIMLRLLQSAPCLAAAAQPQTGTMQVNQPRHKTSRLIVHDLHFVPAAAAYP